MAHDENYVTVAEVELLYYKPPNNTWERDNVRKPTQASVFLAALQ